LQGDPLRLLPLHYSLDFSLRQAIRGREQELGFTLTPQRSRPFPAAVLTDLGYAEDINLIYE
jgi:hypothetical protein